MARVLMSVTCAPHRRSSGRIKGGLTEVKDERARSGTLCCCSVLVYAAVGSYAHKYICNISSLSVMLQ